MASRLKCFLTSVVLLRCKVTCHVARLFVYSGALIIAAVNKKGDRGFTRSDLLVVTIIDLTPFVGASLAMMERDACFKPGNLLVVFNNPKSSEGLLAFANRLEDHLKTPAVGRRQLIDGHGHITKHRHPHDYSH